VLGESASGRPQVEGSGALLSLFWFVGVLLREEGKEERGKNQIRMPTVRSPIA